jgi:hypothetical protein
MVQENPVDKNIWGVLVREFKPNINDHTTTRDHRPGGFPDMKNCGFLRIQCVKEIIKLINLIKHQIMII